MTFLLPFLIIIMIIYAFVRVMNSGRMKKNLLGSRLRWMLGGYVAVLLICTGVSPLLPDNREVNYKIISDGQDLEKESIGLYDAAIEGKIEKIDKKFINKVWSFGYEGQDLMISTENDELISTAIIVERKTTNDGKIEAVHYKTRSGVNNIEITDLEKPLRIELNESALTIMNPEKVQLKFSQFQQAFTVNQFTGEKPFSRATHFYGGTSILYLKIPKDLELVDKSGINYQFIE